MWAPHPRGRVIRRPQPDFAHRRSRIRHKPPPKEVIDTIQDSRCNYKYFGIHRTDITDHLKHTIPSHAFHPSLVGEPPPVIRGRGPRRLKESRRPETAPAPSVWFGRTCSDVSDWLRYRPPAHLGLDPDNKPLPYYPSSSSLVTDPRWQTKEFPTLPNVLWHWWEDRPTSVPLPTNPQKVKFDTLLDALKNRVVRPRGPYTPPTSAPPTSVPTPRSGAQTPHGNNTLGNKMAQTSSQEAPQSRAQTPQLRNFENQPKPIALAEIPSRPASAASSNLPSRPASAASSNLPSRPNSALDGMATNSPTPIPECKCGSVHCSKQASSTPRNRQLEQSPRISPWPPPTERDRPIADFSPRSPHPLGSCGCEAPSDRPKSSCSAKGVQTSTPLSNITKSPPQVEAQKCGCDRSSPSQVPNLIEDKGKTLCIPTTPNSKPQTPPVTSAKPPPSPRALSHPNPPHIPRQPVPREPCKRHHAAVPPGLYVQGYGQGSNSRRIEKKPPKPELSKSSEGLTIDDMKKLSPNSFATKIVWAEKCKQFGQNLPWPLEEKKTVKAY